jgi:hypothetical protein
VFALLLIAVSLSGDGVTKSGIYKNLDDTFDFGSLKGLTNRETFVNKHIPAISKASKDFFHLSSNYFVEGCVYVCMYVCACVHACKALLELYVRMYACMYVCICPLHVCRMIRIGALAHT